MAQLLQQQLRQQAAPVALQPPAAPNTLYLAIAVALVSITVSIALVLFARK